MEILAENHFTLTKSLFYEGMALINQESYGKFAKKAILFVCAAWLVMLAVALWMRTNIVSVLIELAVLGAVVVWIRFFLPRSRAKQAFRALENKYGGDLERTVRFFDDYLELETGGNQVTVDYADIRRVLTSKRLMVLVDGEKKGMLLLLDGFTQGSGDAVRALIEAAQAESEE